MTMARQDDRLKIHNITPAQQMISSCLGSMTTSIFVTPLDVIKVRLQSQQKAIATNDRCFLYCNGLVEELCCEVHAGKDVRLWTRPNLRATTLGTFLNITKNEGVSTLWSGLPTTLAMAVPSTVIYFTMYDQLRYKMTALCKTDTPPLFVPVLAGASARTICVTLISPLEMIRTKMQSTRMSYREICEALRNLVQSQGLTSLWRGVGPTYWRDIPFSAIYWTSYELLKKSFNQETPTWSFSFAAGAISGTVAAVTTLPFDVVKTHLQVELGNKQRISTSKKHTFVLLWQLYRNNGIRALYVGLVPRIVKIAPACAIMISTYEYGKQYFYNYNLSKTLSVK